MAGDRISIDQYFMGMAELVALRSTCPRSAVGAVLTNWDRLISSGYNGAPAKVDHCLDVGCVMVNDHCVATVHAEVNAILQARGMILPGCTLYCTHRPCLECLKVIANAGVKDVVWKTERYGATDFYEKILEQSGIVMRKFEGGVG